LNELEVADAGEIVIKKLVVKFQVRCGPVSNFIGNKRSPALRAGSHLLMEVDNSCITPQAWLARCCEDTIFKKVFSSPELEREADRNDERTA
jgi:hypothetical protein